MLKNKKFTHLTKNMKRSFLFFSSHRRIFIASFLIISTFLLTRGATPYYSELSYVEYSSKGENSGSLVPASCDMRNFPSNDWDGYYNFNDGFSLGYEYPIGSGVYYHSASHFNGDCTTGCPSGTGSYDPYYDPTHSACPINNSTCSTVTVPATMTAGGTYTATISFYNNGGTTWDTTNYKMGSQGPQDNTVWGTNRLGLASNVAPGGYATLSASGLPAPATPGTYTWAWKMLKEGVEWFGTTCSVTVQVVSPPIVNIKFQ